MNINIEISNLNKHFLSFELATDENKPNKKRRSKLVTDDFYSKNEYIISANLKKIPYYSNHFLILEDSEFVNISQLNQQFVEKCNLTIDAKYMIFKYNMPQMIAFNNFLFNIKTPKLFIFNVIESFSRILNSLVVLKKNKICFFNLSPHTIGFNLDCGRKPMIHNFQTSLLVSQMNVNYITNIIKKTDDYTHKPLEVHILFYLIQNEISTISYSFIQTVCEVFIKNASFLCFFSEKSIDSYKDLCVKSLTKYINVPAQDVILTILETIEKWDIYSFSVLYIHIFSSINRVFSLEPCLLTKIVDLLVKNIHPDPLERQSLEQFVEYCDHLFDNETGWFFVNKLPANKMPLLIDVLGK
jgi:hypothetical protein